MKILEEGTLEKVLNIEKKTPDEKETENYIQVSI